MPSIKKVLIETFDPDSETNMTTSGLVGGFAYMIVLIVLALFASPFL